MSAIKLYQEQYWDQNCHDLPYFYKTDSRQLFQSNLALFGSDWIWSKVDIDYNLNSDGYRSREWDCLDFSGSILCFGCSITFGLGVRADQTWVAVLAQSLSIPCINLGLSGGSIQVIWANSVRLIELGIKPRGVVYYWPPHDRSCEFLGSHRVRNWGSWCNFVHQTDHDGGLGSAWGIRDQHSREMGQLYISSLKWDCPVYHYSWADQWSGCSLIRVWLDRGRDQLHPGISSQRYLGQRIASDIRL